MTQCKLNDNEKQGQMTLDLGLGKEIEAKFDGGLISSDGGLVLLRKADEKLRLLESAVPCLEDKRQPELVVHSLLQLLRQRVYAIAAGYEDCNDAKILRLDPMHKLVLDRLPADEINGASQPTLSRFENAIDTASIEALQKLLVHIFISMHKNPPSAVKIRLDGTDDETHGYQQMSFWNGFYQSTCFTPLFIFEDSGFPLAAVLRPGNAAPAAQTLETMKKIVKELRLAWPGIRIELLADAGFAIPELYDFCEDNNIYYAICLKPNEILQKHASKTIKQCKANWTALGHEMHDYIPGEKGHQIWKEREEKKRYASKSEGRMQEHRKQDSLMAREFDTFDYQAESWRRQRTIVVKCDYSLNGSDVRYVVTNFRGRTPKRLYEDIYCKRSRCENWIKELKNQLNCDRTSCQEFVANQFRLLLHTFAYVLLWEIRKDAGYEHVEIRTVMLYLIKVSALVKETARKIWLHLSSSHPAQQWFAKAWAHT